MVATQRERELKFDTPSHFSVPAADDLVGRAARSERSVVHFDSTYYDTAQLNLLGHRVTLRRREGDDDTGWQLKVPAGSARTEIRMPLEAAPGVPDRLTAVVAGLIAGDALVPVAIVKTTRQRTRVLDGGRLLVEIAQDEVVGTVLGSAATATTWHELEVELGEDDEALLSEVGERLIAAGAAPARTPSKLARTLGWSDPAESAGADAHGILVRYLYPQLLELGAGDVGLRRGLDPVHKTRVAARRVRSALRVFADVWLDPTEAAHIDDELCWYQDLLGEVRDRQVLRARFADRVSDLPDALVLGPVSAMIDEKLLSEQAAAREALTAAMDTERYMSLMRSVQKWASNPPVRPGAEVDDVLRMAGKAQRAARKRLKKALAAGSSDLLHRARKAAKRARYATELTAPVVGNRAAKQVKVYKRAQDLLGEHQDSVIAATVLQRLGAAATAPDQNGFTFGLLYEREQATALRTRHNAHTVLARLP